MLPVFRYIETIGNKHLFSYNVDFYEHYAFISEEGKKFKIEIGEKPHQINRYIVHSIQHFQFIFVVQTAKLYRRWYNLCVPHTVRMWYAKCYYLTSYSVRMHHAMRTVCN